MEYSFDDIFKIGDGHKVCEDYSWSGMIQEEYPCVIVSDGCSSSENTDIGARILVRSMIYVLERLKLERNGHEENFNLICGLMNSHVKHICDLMGLEIPSLDATLLMSIVINDDLFMFKYGDGSIVFRNHTTGDMIRHYTEYPYNAPFYYNYTREDSYEKTYLENYGDQSVIIDGEAMPVTDYVADRDLHWGVVPLGSLLDGVWTVTLMTDGVETFFEGNNKVDFDEVLNGLTAFKNFRGEYVQRKVGKYLNGLAKNNIKHYDDIAVASIKFEVKNDE